MPRRDDLSSILIIGSGPIVIGQACEFDYSGTQACRVLKDEGYRVVLANSNPATIMTDPDFAHRTYVEPLTWEVVARIIERERPDAVLPTLGGQTGLNTAMALFERGLVGVPGTPELIGANAEAIATAEDREKFKEAMIEIGLSVPKSGIAHTVDEARDVVGEIGLPVIIRPAYILGGRGTGIASTSEEFDRLARLGLEASPIGEILIEKSIAGWKEYELEVMRDRADNCVIICSIENFDPMGVHTGDSITVAPAQTLSDVEYQRMRDAAFACIRRVGVETGGSNVQFAVDPTTGEQVVIEMNPRVSRSSALASKATGFPIAKIAAKLAIGYTLDEIPNDITKKTPASFEPTIDYVVTKVPRWAFEKLPGTSGVLGTQMQSVGEVMSIGRTFPESLQKALRSLEQGRAGLNADATEKQFDDLTDDELLARVAVPTPERIFQIGELLRRGVSIEAIHDTCRVDPWFLDQMSIVVEERIRLEASSLEAMGGRDWKRAKRLGFSDAQLAHLWGCSEDEVRAARVAKGILPTYKTVDTCSAEFDAETPYHYSTYEDENEIRESDRPRVVILGSGPNRIGQGIEFDYCCVHGLLAIKECGFEAIMVNCNPETVSTDFDIADKLYFEPVFWEHLWELIEYEKPEGVIVQLGGQTALKLAEKLHNKGIKIIGTSYDNMDIAEDRGRFSDMLKSLNIPYPEYGTAYTVDEAVEVAKKVGYPVLVRPSYVLGGQRMRIVINDEEVESAVVSLLKHIPGNKILIDHFLDRCQEAEIDAIFDGENFHVMGVMEHIEPAGIHSGDSNAVLPAFNLSPMEVSTMEHYAEKIARALDIRGLINIQFAIKAGKVYVIEANPRASRTTPFIAKAYQIPYLNIATKVMMGTHKLTEFTFEKKLKGFAIKEPVFSFDKFPGVNKELGPEMKSTGEAIRFVKDLHDPYFRALYKERSMHLSK